MNVRTDPPSKPSVQAFLQTLHQSGLLSREQIRDALAACPAEAQTNAARLAEYCVASGLLTRFQADKLLEGVTVGLVLGPYHVLSPIGRGGMGTVYMARDNRNRELVALKVLPPKRAKQDEVTLARFRREMDLARVVCHPRITQTYEVGVVQGIYYIAMEYVAGRSLAQYLHEVGTLPVGRAARVAIEIAEGLEQAHARGLIHRDLKPSNVMLTHDGHCKILDFGLAIMQDEEPPGDISITGGKGYVVGTMDYISPEQAEDPLQVDPRSDLYSLGCSLYRMTAGRVPFPGGNGLQKIMRHRTELAPLVHTLNPDIPREFSELIARFMAKDPSDRPQNAQQARRLLERWADPIILDQSSSELLGLVEASSGQPDQPERLAKPGQRQVPVAAAAPQENPPAATLPAPTPLPPTRSATSATGATIAVAAPIASATHASAAAVASVPQPLAPTPTPLATPNRIEVLLTAHELGLWVAVGAVAVLVLDLLIVLVVILLNR
jgi:serine/threonine protein kinase